MIKFDRSLFFLIFGRLLQAGLSIITLRMMTEILDQAEVGHQYLINSLILGFSLILINPVGMYVNRHLHEWKAKSQLLPAMKAMNRYFLIVAALSIPIVVILRFAFNFSENILLLTLVGYVALYIFLSTWFQSLISFFNLLGHQDVFVTLNILSVLIGLIAAILLTHFFSPQALNWLGGLLIGQAISLMVGLVLLGRQLKDQPEKSDSLIKSFFSRNTFLFCYPVALTTVFMWLTTQGYRFWVEKNSGLEALAYLGVGLGLAASLAAIVESLTTQWLYPYFYSQMSATDSRERQKSWELLWQRSLAIYIPFLFVSLVASPLVIKLLVSEKFHGVGLIFYFGCGIEFLRLCSGVLYIAAHSEKKTSTTIGPYALGAGVLFLSLFMLIQYQGLTDQNILWALISASLSTFIFNLFRIRKLMQVQLFNFSLLKIILTSSPILLFLFIPIVSTAALVGAISFASVFAAFIVYRNLNQT